MLQRSVCVVLNRSVPYGSRARALVTKHCTWKYIHETAPSISQYTSKYVRSIDKPDFTRQKFKHFYCGELTTSSIGKYVELEGTVYKDDEHLVLEDETGVVHLTVNDKNKDVLALTKELRMNSYLKIVGLVMENPFSNKEGTIAVVIENVISKPSFKNDSGKENHADMKLETSILTLHPLEQSKCTSGDVLKFFFQRTHSCNIKAELIGMNVTLCGWVAAELDGKCFVLQDGYGLVPVIYDRQDGNITKVINNLKNKKLVSVKGIVTNCPDYPYADNPMFQNNIAISLTSLEVIDDGYNKEKNILENCEAQELNSISETKESLKSSDMLLPKMNGSMIPDINKYTTRSHTCGELNENHIGQKVKLMGWVEFQRLDRFILLRDKYGLIQLSVDPSDKILRSKLLSLSIESVISVEGTVCARPEGQENKRMKTGAIEVLVEEIEIINQSETLPFTSKSKAISKHVQLKYRYLDLRLNPTIMNNLTLRCDVIHKMRKYLIENLGFLEVETPTLFKKTPGGAQEFIVPTRNKREFYSLVQSPQQFKQLLMVGSVDKYFQIARCYRDETSRKDRQPEFTQLDIEMSFCDREGIINLIEDVLKFAWPKNLGSITTPFPKITYEDAMKTYGSDKPDTRIEMKISDLTNIFTKEKGEWSEKINFQSMRDLEDFAAHCLVIPEGKANQIKLKKLAKEKSMENKFPIYTFIPKTKYGFEFSLRPIFSPSIALDIAESVYCDADDAVFLGLGPKNTILKTFGEMRLNAAEILNENHGNMTDKSMSFNFLWVVDFPLFEINDEGLIQSVHHPFTQVHPDDKHLLKTNPLKARSLHFDLVANGKELGGGSVRIHDAETQKEILENILNVDISTLNHLLKALAMGAPIHGGFALGIDRLIALLSNAPSLMDVIAFPKFHSGRDPLSGAPSDIPKSDKILYKIDLNDEDDEKNRLFTADEDVQETKTQPESQ